MIGPGPQDAGWLPRLTTVRVTYLAESPGLLPPLPTTSFHGALARALWKEVCLAPARPTCRGCPAQRSCAYARLFEPAVDSAASDLPGITTEPPRPLIVAPDPPLLPTRQAPIPVSAGDPVPFRLVLVGPPQGLHMSLIRSLRRAGRRGLGNGRSAVRLRMVDADRGEAPVAEAPAPRRVTLRLLTPLRLKSGGQVLSELSAADLVVALVRRARLVAAAAGTPWKPPFDEAEVARQLRLAAALRVVRVRRHSARQGRHMTWPGLVGELRVSGAGLQPLWPLLRFCETAQLGKGTSFGFGRYAIRAAAAARGR